MSTRKKQHQSKRRDAMKFIKLLKQAMRTGSAEGDGMRIYGVRMLPPKKAS